RVNVGLERVDAHEVADVSAKKFHRDFVGHELAAAGVIHELLTDGRARIERAEDITHREMEKARDVAEDFPLRAFAAAGGAEQEVSVILHATRGASSVQICVRQGGKRQVLSAQCSDVSAESFSPSVVATQ